MISWIVGTFLVLGVVALIGLGAGVVILWLERRPLDESLKDIARRERASGWEGTSWQFRPRRGTYWDSDEYNRHVH